MGDSGHRGLVNVFAAVLCFCACSSFLWRGVSSELTLTQETGKGRPVELGDEIIYKCIVTHSGLLRWAIEPVIPKRDPLKFWPHEISQEPVKIRGNFKVNLTESVEDSDGSYNMTSYLKITVGLDFQQVRRIECRSTLEIMEADDEGEVVIGFDSKVLSISESQNAILIAVLRIISGGIVAGESKTVHVTSRSGTALGGGVDFDFTQADYVFTDTKTVHYVSVTIVEDFIHEQSESFQLLASSSDAGVTLDPDKVDVKIINQERKDINECETNNGGCSQICTDTIGSFRCSCRLGYVLASDGKSCNNINECNSNNGGCSQICTDTEGSFRCSCRQGYALARDGRSCNNINECDTNNGGCSQICTDTEGSYRCSCRRGFALASDGRSCNSINACATNNGGCSHICTDRDGAAKCSCRRGYALARDGRTCNNVNECDTNNGGCSQICTDTEGSFRCSCRRGFVLANNQRSCNSMNACEPDNGGCSHICTDIDGKARCSCKSGYVLASNRKSCNNINECETKNGGCSHLCTDTIGSFRCSCRRGYALASNGKRCNNINECLTNNGGCSQICTDTEGSFRCSCEDGYTLASDERGCEGGMTVQMAVILIILLVVIIVAIIITCAQRDSEDKESTCTKFVRSVWTKCVDTVKSFTVDIWLIIIGFAFAILAIVFGPTLLYDRGVSSWTTYRVLLALILLVLLALIIIAVMANSGKRSIKSILVDGWTAFVDGVCSIIGSLTSFIANIIGSITGSDRPRITTQPTDVLDVVPGDQATMTVAATGEGAISYQWNKNREKIPGECSDKLTISNVASDDEGEYQCVVSNDAGASVTSKIAHLTLLTAPRITTHPADILNATPGKTVTMLCMANGGTLRYQWQKDSKNIQNGTYHTYCITVTSADNEGDYRCVVSNEVGETISDKAQLTVSMPVTEHPKILSHPADIRNAAPGKQITLEVIACGNDILYQWKKNGEDIPGATSRLFTIFDVTDEDEGSYSCVVSNEDGTETSNAATVTVCMRLQVHYIFCDKLFSKEAEAKVVTNLNPLCTTMKDLCDHIRSKEDMMEGEVIELFSHEGYPLNANVHTLKCTLKEWKVSNDDLFYVFVRRASQLAWRLLDPPVESPADHTTGKDELHIMSSLFELFTIRTDLDIDTSQTITRKVASAVKMPSNYILLYTRGKMLLTRNSELESGDILTLVLKRPYKNNSAQGTEFGKKTYSPIVPQTDRGVSKFFSILKFICSKKRETGDKDFRARFLSYLLHLTNCPPMVHALKLLFENSKLSLSCWVALVEGCYQLFFCLLNQFDIDRKETDDASLSNVFEFSDYFWGLILSKSKTFRASIVYKKQTLMCPISELKMSLPVTIPGHDVIEYQSVSEYVKDEDMTVDFFLLRMLVYHPWDCDEDVYIRTGEVPVSRCIPAVQKPCNWEDLPSFLSLLLIKPPNYINSECLTYILHGYVVYFVGFLSPDDKQDGKRRIYDPIKCDFSTYTENTLGTFAKTTTVVNDLKKSSGDVSQEAASEPEVAITVLLDCSGSMRTVFDNKTRMDAAKEFFKILVTHCCKIYKLKCAMRLMAYSTDTTELLPMTVMDSSSILRFEVALKNAVAEGETALYQAIEEALEGYSGPGQHRNCRRYIVCLCDGKNNKGEFDPEMIKNLQAAEVVVDAIIIGNKGDTNLRKIIEETGGECCHPQSISEIWPWKTSSPFHAHHTQAQQRVQDIC